MSWLARLFSPVVVDQLHNIFIAAMAIAAAYGVSTTSPVVTAIGTAFAVIGSVSSSFNLSSASRAAAAPPSQAGASNG